ncbi:hypothetical protein [Actinomadura sp. 3N508]|uniref:hypothetical protein n=1 Tax=Actinomadura sp. 3N508 TaxID=3375153 RepID=UPI00378D146A
MTCSRWEDLPASLRIAVSRRVGEVFSAEPARPGLGAEIVAILRTANDPVFLKGIHLGGRRAEVRRIEVKVQPYLPRIAPRLLGHIEASGWLLLLFEYVHGRHADLGAESKDLPDIARLVTDLSQVRRPRLPVLPVERRWAPFADGLNLRLLEGDTLVHTDLTAGNILVGERLRVVDWAWPTRGADWLDTASLVVRLIQAGHPPGQAEEWARQIPAWRNVTDAALSVFLRTRLSLAEHQPHADVHTALASWQEHRSKTDS